MHQQSDRVECHQDRLTCSCTEICYALFKKYQPHPASGISLFQSVQSLHISADLRAEGVAAGGDDSPHRVLILIQHSSRQSGQDQ